MDGFKTLPKMQHFKEGGAAYCGGGRMKKGGEVADKDMAQDKALIKKAFKQHDKAEHDKEPTEIKLKKGGRSAKDCGTVRKFKVGGTVSNVYEAKKKSGDIDNIEKTKDIKPGKADAKSGAKEMPNKYKTGGAVKKFADGRTVDAKAVSDKASRELEEALNPISMAKEVYGKAKNALGYGAKTGIEAEAAKDSAARDYKKFGPVQGPADDQRIQKGMTDAQRQARDEIRRETRGKAPGAYKKGGSLKKMNTGGTAC